jgi:hypothetical protein
MGGEDYPGIGEKGTGRVSQAFSAGRAAVLGQAVEQSFRDSLRKLQKGVICNQDKGFLGGIDDNLTVPAGAQVGLDLDPQLNGDLFVDIRGDLAQEFFTANHRLALPG